MKGKNKKVVDYVEKKGDILVMFGGRVPKGKRNAVMKKMKKDGIPRVQDLIEAMMDRYLDE